MAKTKKMTNKEIAQIVENEGLGYAIEDYMDGTNFLDANLKVHWQHAKREMDAIMVILQPEIDKMDEEDVDEDED